MANSTLKALIAFDGIIMTDYLQDYMRHTNAGTHSAQLSIIVRFNYKELQWDDTQEITSLPPPRLTQCPNYVRQRTDKALRSSTITNKPGSTMQFKARALWNGAYVDHEMSIHK